jgi:hypothetical protein
MSDLILEQTSQKINEKSAMGLSMAHISRKKGEIILYKDGALIKTQKPGFKHAQAGGGLRGSITEFSKASRRRLLQMIAKTKKSDLPVFVTLTYPGVFPEDSTEWKHHIDKFFKNLIYRFPDLGIVWKLEPQKRLAPHYHLLVWGADYESLRSCVPGLWYRAVGSHDERHLRAGTQVSHIRSWRGIMAYAGKYLAKTVDSCGWDSPGRFWGVTGRKNIPWSEVKTIEITEKQAFQILRAMRRYARIRSRSYESLTLYVNKPARWACLLC